MLLQNKVAFITGAAKGMGLATSEIFIREGAKVIAMDKDKEAGTKAKERLGDNYFFIAADLMDSEKIKEAFETGLSQFGQLNFLINNAGIVRYANAVTCTEEDWDQVMNINLKAAFICAKYGIPYMQKSGGGVIINLASAQSFVSSSNMVHYTTSKSALLGFTRSLAIDFGPDIRAIAICPGSVDTPMAREAWSTARDPEAVHQESIKMHILNRIGKPEEIGEMIAFLCSDKCSFITGQAIRIDGGLGISVPGSVENDI